MSDALEKLIGYAARGVLDESALKWGSLVREREQEQAARIAELEAELAALRQRVASDADCDVSDEQVAAAIRAFQKWIDDNSPSMINSEYMMGAMRAAIEASASAGMQS